MPERSGLEPKMTPKAVAVKTLAVVVATWDGLREARREFRATYRTSYYALTSGIECPDLPDPSEGRGMGGKR